MREEGAVRQSFDMYGISDSTYSIPPFSVKMFSLHCLLSLTEWNYEASVEHFTNGCSLKQVQVDYFESKKKELLEILSKLENDNQVWTVDVALMVTEKSFPVIGSMRWKEKRVLNNFGLRCGEKFVFETREKVAKWKFADTYVRDRYLSFIHYLEQQGRPIRDTLIDRSSSPSHTAFPDDAQYEYARQTLSRKDPEFGDLWLELISYREDYDRILRVREAQTRGFQLTPEDERKIRILIQVLDKVLEKTQSLRDIILREL